LRPHQHSAWLWLCCAGLDVALTNGPRLPQDRQCFFGAPVGPTGAPGAAKSGV